MTKTDTWQTRPLVREGAPKRQDSNIEKKNLWSNVPDLGLTPRHTDWLTVSRNATLTLTNCISHLRMARRGRNMSFTNWRIQASFGRLLILLENTFPIMEPGPSPGPVQFQLASSKSIYFNNTPPPKWRSLKTNFMCISCITYMLHIHPFKTKFSSATVLRQSYIQQSPLLHTVLQVTFIASLLRIFFSFFSNTHNSYGPSK
jgi:hypothetical protein